MKRVGHVIRLATELGIVMGLVAAGSALLGLAVGRWLDARLGTGPYATIALLLAGAAAGQTATYRLATRSSRLLSARARHALTARDTVAAAGLALRVLVLVSLPSLIGLVLGMWIDRMIGTRILMGLLLALAGLAAGMVATVRLAYAHRPGPGEKDEKECSESTKDR